MSVQAGEITTPGFDYAGEVTDDCAGPTRRRRFCPRFYHTLRLDPGYSGVETTIRIILRFLVHSFQPSVWSKTGFPFPAEVFGGFLEIFFRTPGKTGEVTP